MVVVWWCGRGSGVVSIVVVWPWCGRGVAVVFLKL